jgi:hypothetical protein
VSLVFSLDQAEGDRNGVLPFGGGRASGARPVPKQPFRHEIQADHPAVLERGYFESAAKY